MASEPLTAKPSGKDGGPNLPVLPPVLPFVALVLTFFGEMLVPLTFLQPVGAFGWQFWVGVGILLAGFGFGVAGIRAFRDAGTHVEPFKPALVLVTDGPYRLTRNAMYLGFVLLLAGLGLAASLEWALVLTPVLWIALDRIVVVREERYLTAKFGETYDDFRRRTRRWL